MNFNFFSSGWCHCFHLLFRILLNVWDKAVAAIVVNWFIYFQKIVLHFLFNIFFWSISTTNNQKRKSNYTTIDLNNITMYHSFYTYGRNIFWIKYFDYLHWIDHQYQKYDPVKYEPAWKCDIRWVYGQSTQVKKHSIYMHQIYKIWLVFYWIVVVF